MPPGAEEWNLVPPWEEMPSPVPLSLVLSTMKNPGGGGGWAPKCTKALPCWLSGPKWMIEDDDSGGGGWRCSWLVWILGSIVTELKEEDIEPDEDEDDDKVSEEGADACST